MLGGLFGAVGTTLCWYSIQALQHERSSSQRSIVSTDAQGNVVETLPSALTIEADGKGGEEDHGGGQDPGYNRIYRRLPEVETSVAEVGPSGDQTGVVFSEDVVQDADDEEGAAARGGVVSAPIEVVGRGRSSRGTARRTDGSGVKSSSRAGFAPLLAEGAKSRTSFSETNGAKKSSEKKSSVEFTHDDEALVYAQLPKPLSASLDLQQLLRDDDGRQADTAQGPPRLSLAELVEQQLEGESFLERRTSTTQQKTREFDPADELSKTASPSSGANGAHEMYDGLSGLWFSSFLRIDHSEVSFQLEVTSEKGGVGTDMIKTDSLSISCDQRDKLGFLEEGFLVCLFFEMRDTGAGGPTLIRLNNPMYVQFRSLKVGKADAEDGGLASVAVFRCDRLMTINTQMEHSCGPTAVDGVALRSYAPHVPTLWLWEGQRDRRYAGRPYTSFHFGFSPSVCAPGSFSQMVMDRDDPYILEVTRSKEKYQRKVGGRSS